METTALSEKEQALAAEVARLREALREADDLREAISSGRLDGLIVGTADGSIRVELLTTAYQRYRALLEGLNQGIVTVSSGGELLYANRRFLAAVKEEPNALPNKYLAAYLAPVDAERILSRIAAGAADWEEDAAITAADGTQSTMRLCAIGQDGGQVTLLVCEPLPPQFEEAASTVRAIQDGDIDGLVVEEDVYMLRDAHRSYMGIIDRINDGALVTTSEGEIIYANMSVAGMLGIGRDSLVGTPVQEFFEPEMRPRIAEMLGRREAFECELSLPRPDGSRLPVLVSGQFRDESHCLILRDISEMRRRQALQELDRQKNEFIAMLSHELRNPLSPILNAAEMLKKVQSDDSRIAYAAEVILRQAKSLTRMIDELLDVDRMSRGHVELQLNRCDLCDVVEQAIESVQPVMTERQLELNVRRPERPITVNVDAMRLQQAIVNILTNAARYTPKRGRIDIRVETGHEPAAEAFIRVRDSGIGMSAEEMNGIFRPFTRGVSGTVKESPGLGIGLTLCQRIVALHGGSVSATSPGPGKGSEFTIRIPRPAPAAS